jgi:hypothetical protein
MLTVHARTQREPENGGWLSSVNLPVILTGAIAGVAVLVGSKKLYDFYRRR